MGTNTMRLTAKEILQLLALISSGKLPTDKHLKAQLTRGISKLQHQFEALTGNNPWSGKDVKGPYTEGFRWHDGDPEKMYTEEGTEFRPVDKAVADTNEERAIRDFFEWLPPSIFLVNSYGSPYGEDWSSMGDIDDMLDEYFGKEKPSRPIAVGDVMLRGQQAKSITIDDGAILIVTQEGEFILE